MGAIEILMIASFLLSGIGVVIWIIVMAFLFLEALSKVMTMSDD
jgi:type IV secretory pathway TrbD component